MQSKYEDFAKIINRIHYCHILQILTVFYKCFGVDTVIYIQIIFNHAD